jgi:hypothetical protein
MHSLYLHGLHSTHINERTDWLARFGTISNPLMNYHNYPENFKQIEKILLQQTPDVIVASSLGAYFAFHLGNYYRIPTILLNPALLMTNIVKPDNRLLASDTLHTISIGVNDTVILPWTTRAVLQQLQANHQIFEYNIGHETPFDVFLDICNKSGIF